VRLTRAPRPHLTVPSTYAHVSFSQRYRHRGPNPLRVYIPHSSLVPARIRNVKGVFDSYSSSASNDPLRDCSRHLLAEIGTFSFVYHMSLLLTRFCVYTTRQRLFRLARPVRIEWSILRPFTSPPRRGIVPSLPVYFDLCLSHSPSLCT
jgi:hypothetical protein